MADFNEDEIDEGFRRVIEGKSVEPPASLWANIRISALERQLIRYQSINLWLKGAAGVLAALLGGSILLHFTQKTPLLIKKEVVTISKTDTVYVTKPEKVFVNRPIVVYVQNSRNKPNDTNANFSETEQDEKINLANSVLGKEQIDQNDLMSAANPRRNGQEKDKNKRGMTQDNKSKYTKQNYQINDQNDSQKRKEVLLEEPSRSGLENDKLVAENAVLAPEVFTVDYLEPLSIASNEPLMRIPSIKYYSTQKTATKPLKVRTPLIDKLSVSSYVSPEWNRIDVRRDEPKAFNFGDEDLKAGVTTGLRVGIKISKKWLLLTGMEFNRTSFDNQNRRQILPAEAVEGRFGYLYRTALGTVEIPAEKLSVPAQSGSSVGVEIDSPIQRDVISVPLLVRYNVWDKQFRFLNRVPLKLQFYGLLGGYWQMPVRQEGKVEVYEDSGREFTSELTQFQNLRNSYEVNVGIGTELGVGKHFNLFVEPNYSQGISSLVGNMPIRSVVSSFGLKMGIKWDFGKQ